MALKLTRYPGQKIRLVEITDEGERTIGMIGTQIEWSKKGPCIALYFDCEKWLGIVREEVHRNDKSTRHIHKDA